MQSPISLFIIVKEKPCQFSYIKYVLNNNIVNEVQFCDDKDSIIYKYDIEYSENNLGKSYLISNYEHFSNSNECYFANIKYDKAGRVIERSYLDNKRNIITSETSWAIIRYKYNEKGYLTETSYYDKNNKLVLHSNLGAAIERFKYDENGNNIKKVFMTVIINL